MHWNYLQHITNKLFILYNDFCYRAFIYLLSRRCVGHSSLFISLWEIQMYIICIGWRQWKFSLENNSTNQLKCNINNNCYELLLLFLRISAYRNNRLGNNIIKGERGFLRVKSMTWILFMFCASKTCIVLHGSL